jgi:hypothetical protein
MPTMTRQFLTLLLAILIAGEACAQSVDFNGTTSKAEHTTADVLSSAKTITVLAWVNADGQGEGNFGRVASIDEVLTGSARWTLVHQNQANVLRIDKQPGGAGTVGTWTFPCTDGQWNAVAIRHDFSGDNAPTARVNFAAATVTEVSAPVGINDQPATGYCMGNASDGSRTWDGKIAYLQVFNSILSDADCDKGLRSPGSVASRLYLPMTTSTDINDGSGNGFDATGTDLATGANGPGVYFLKKMMAHVQ